MTRRFLVLVLVVAFAGTCSESPFDPIGDGPLPVHTAQGVCAYRTIPEGGPLPGGVGQVNFFFYFHGLADVNGPVQQVCLDQKTDEFLSCANFLIVETVEVDHGLIEIRHLGIDDPDLCLTAFGPAQAHEGFDLPLGTYTLRFKSGLLTDEYELVSSESGVDVTPLRPPQYTSYRVPF